MKRPIGKGSGTTDAHEREKDFLNASEIEKLLKAAKRGRHGVRDYLSTPIIYRHSGPVRH